MYNAGFDMLVLFYSQVDVLLLIFVRVLAFFMFVPVLSSQNLWITARLFLAFCISVALFLSGIVNVVHFYDSTPGYVYLILVEFLVGAFIAYSAFAVFNLMFFAGQLMDYQIGFSMVNVMDPMTQIQVPVIGNLYYLSLMALLVVTGGLHALFGTFFTSYQLLPIGVGYVVGNSELAFYIVNLLAETMVMAVRISMPIIGTILVVNVALGIMVKTVPQMNIFVVGMPLKVLIGLILLFTVVTPYLVNIFDMIFTMAQEAMEEVIWGLIPR